ncbi:phage tail tape measure protein [Escherichia coli]|nr:phage tail tape measure protein [Escherichia coli]
MCRTREEFNSVNESGDRIVRALAAGMGVARKDLKAMADDGKLTADKVVPALISQLGYCVMNMPPCRKRSLVTRWKTPLWPGWVARMKPAG